jgi:carboxymethylenebutenolidase
MIAKSDKTDIAMRRFTLLFLSLFIAGAAFAQHDHGDAKATVTTSIPVALHGKNVTFGDAMGYLSLPASGGRHPAVIVIQEWWGLNDWVKQQADRFAKQGYVALAVDLYRGKVATDTELAHELSRGLPEDRAIADLKAGVDFVARRDDVNAAKIGVIGWCMGGGYSLGLSLADPRIAATVVNYGHLVTDPDTIAKIHAPILGNFGGADRGIPPADVKAFDAAMSKVGKSFDVKIYDGAGHAFMNPNNTGGYVPAAAEDAVKRVDAFFMKHLH